MSGLKITFQTVSAKGALLGGPQFLENIKKIARKATFVAATKAHKEMARRIRVPKAGRIYKRKSVIHRASAPGQAPANDTGNLIGSIHHIQGQDQGGTVSSSVVVTASYAKWLEYGTRRMAERPFVRPTKVWVGPIFKEYMAQKLRKLNKGEVDTSGGES